MMQSNYTVPLKTIVEEMSCSPCTFRRITTLPC